MSRSYAPVLTSIWQDPDFITRTAGAQRLYILAFSQPDTSYCGVVPCTIRRWARLAPDTKPRDIERGLDELEHAGLIAVDDDTEELWIRSFVKHNRVLEQPQIRTKMRREYGEIHSPAIRQAFLASLPDDEAAHLHPHRQPAGQPDPQGAEQPAENPDGQPADQPDGEALVKAFDLDLDRNQHHHPHPDPNPAAPCQPPPADETDRPAGDGAPTGRRTNDHATTIDAAWPILAEWAYRAELDKGVKITKPAAWKRAVADNQAAEHTDQAAKLLDEYPDPTVHELAAAIHGDALPIRHRVTPPADWGDPAPPEHVHGALDEARAAIGRPRR